MNSSLTRMFDGLGGTGWWIIILFFLFLAFQECWAEICITDWIPFLILLLIVCSCSIGDDCGCIENNMDYDCNCSC
ncbi:hypothetical protein [Terrisporobacter mayombei]|uniref:hypothetical protein n=1 Tax=Terrisporobacter mayombei TaxID=1541 RepID=UPI001D161D13|nr:hypothetical protein [Terrisporobacter mayombei]MCC3867761.1 hypothetical protein [Terrisporobacter mayombei]